ncbi:MAG: 3-deoxy-D-manno-octulosonic acid transferase [Fuerstiella sp.]|nr:3-deoxy-D-manno-octulosonic acid transferase [Fuerstiella sp.]
MDFLMKWVLNCIYALLLLMLSPVILWRSYRHGRYRTGWREKLLGSLPISSGSKPVVWFHAVSVGEVVQLQKIVDRFRTETDDGFKIVVTSSTDTGFELAASRFTDCSVSWFPLDFSWAVSNAIRRVKPAMVVLVELELWPNFLRECGQAGVMTALVNARLSERSFRGYSRVKPIMAPLFEQFHVVTAPTEEYASRVRKLGASATVTQVTGSIKFDGVTANHENAATSGFRRLFAISDNDVVLIAGSTQHPEEQMALDAWMELRKERPNLRLILVPRHKERFDDVAAIVRASGCRLYRRSESSEGEIAPVDAVILLDTIGELSACWGLADIAFVGGSFGSRGGQNMLEPAAHGAAVLFGPNTWNFKDIVEQLRHTEAAVQLQTRDEFLPTVNRLLSDADSRQRLGQNAQRTVVAQQGAVEKTTRLLRDAMFSDSFVSRDAA